MLGEKSSQLRSNGFCTVSFDKIEQIINANFLTYSTIYICLSSDMKMFLLWSQSSSNHARMYDELFRICIYQNEWKDILNAFLKQFEMKRKNKKNKQFAAVLYLEVWEIDWSSYSYKDGASVEDYKQI